MKFTFIVIAMMTLSAPGNAGYRTHIIDGVTSKSVLTPIKWPAGGCGFSNFDWVKVYFKKDNRTFYWDIKTDTFIKNRGTTNCHRWRRKAPNTSPGQHQYFTKSRFLSGNAVR